MSSRPARPTLSKTPSSSSGKKEPTVPRPSSPSPSSLARPNSPTTTRKQPSPVPPLSSQAGSEAGSPLLARKDSIRFPSPKPNSFAVEEASMSSPQKISPAETATAPTHSATTHSATERRGHPGLPIPIPGLSGQPNGPVGNLLKGPIHPDGRLKDAALMVGIKLDLEAEVHLSARVRGDILVGLY